MYKKVVHSKVTTVHPRLTPLPFQSPTPRVVNKCVSGHLSRSETKWGEFLCQDIHYVFSNLMKLLKTGLK